MRLLIVPICASLAACAAPDLTQELEAFSSSAKTVNTELMAYATPRAEAERQRGRQAMLRQGQPPIKVNCQIGTPLRDCRILENYELADSDAVWTETLRFAKSLGRYLEAFEALLSVKTPAEIGTRTTALLGVVASFADTPAAGLPASFTARAGATSGPLGALAEQAARARQYRALRDAAEPVDQALEDTLIALQEEPGLFPKVEQAHERLFTASRALETTKAPTAKQVADVEAKHRAYVAAVKETPIENFLLMREAHAGLLAALKRNATPQEVLTFINTLNDLKSALEEN